jgi:hypothetical protein
LAEIDLSRRADDLKRLNLREAPEQPLVEPTQIRVLFVTAS